MDQNTIKEMANAIGAYPKEVERIEKKLTEFWNGRGDGSGDNVITINDILRDANENEVVISESQAQDIMEALRALINNRRINFGYGRSMTNEEKDTWDDGDGEVVIEQ